jgi:hypothetical protein
MKVKFLHVPKTAGTSVRIFLQQFFLSRHICPATDNLEFLALSPEQLRSYRLFTRHFDWTHLDQIEGESFTFSICAGRRIAWSPTISICGPKAPSWTSVVSRSTRIADFTPR